MPLPYPKTRTHMHFSEKSMDRLPIRSPRPLKVLQVLEATEGGTRRHLFDLVTHLDPARFSVSVACSMGRDPAFLKDIRQFEARGIAVHTLPMRRALNPVWDMAALFGLVRLMRRGGYDIVHTHSSKAGFLGRLAARLAGIPRVVHTPHVFPFDMDAGRASRACYVRLERLAARWTDCLVCVCPSQRATAEALMDASKVVVVENEIDGPTQALPAGDGRLQDLESVWGRRSSAGLPAGALLVGAIGRLAPQKGPAYFVEAARLVAQQLPEVRFVWVGDGPLRPAIESQVAAAGLQERFVLAGARDRAADLLGLMDVVVMPSLWEGLPYALLEAMAAGRAVVATRVGGIPDVVVDSSNGLLVAPRDAPVLAAAVLKVLTAADLRARLEDQARKSLAARPGLAMMVARLSDVYEGGNSVNGSQE